MKYTHIIGIIIIAGLLIVGALVFMGYISIPSLDFSRISDSNAVTTPILSNCAYGDRDMFLALEGVTGKTLSYSQFLGYANSLNMQMCHHDRLNYLQIIEFYKSQFEEEGYNHVTDYTFTNTGWSAVVTYYISDDNTDVKSCIAGSGSAVTVAFGHRTMFMTANGPATSWLEFYRWITT